MIPKIIHYCWFGGSELPDLAKKCIESWKKYCPDYEIIRWDESNFNCECCEYVKEAYKAKKWAFVSDYARFWILYNYGGIYFDTDVELVKPIDEIVSNGSFMGSEPGDPLPKVAPGLGMGTNAGNIIYKKILDYYKKEKFILNDGTINSETVVTKVSKIMESNGYKNSNDIECVCGINIYPPEFFCPKNYYSGKLSITNNTVSIHHYSASWYEPEELKCYLIKQKIVNFFGRKIGKFIYIPIHYFYRLKLHGRKNGGLIKALIYTLNKRK